MTTEYKFDAEIPKLMNMIIHNFYSSKDIFLRELISNASDAIDKARYLIFSNNKLETYDPNIKIIPNKDDNTLIIEDNGIGMNEQDLVNCLGTIAKSGTQEFIKNMINQNNNTLIGQFGVGFYSAFLVADLVTVYTKHIESDNNDVLVWESNARDGYTISTIDDSDFKNGTKIILKLTNEQLDYLEEFKLKEIIKKHSGYISHPILLQKKIKIEKKVEEKNNKNENEDEDIEDIDMDNLEKSIKKDNKDDEEVKDDEVDEVKDDEVDEVKDDEAKDEEVKDDEVKDDEVKDEEVKDDEYKYEFEIISNQPIWYLDPKEVTKEQYECLYKSLTSNEYNEFLTYKHFKAEGEVEFSSILYIPKHAIFDKFDKSKKNNCKLYVKKVLITDECKELYPEYFDFITCIVDSQDLPLNVSRELLQQSKVIKKMNKILVKKTIELLLEINEDNDYNKSFYEQFSKNIKLAIHEDSVNKSKLLELLRFNSTKSEDNLLSLKTYVSNMKEEQAGIYYIIGNTQENVKKSAFIDKLIKKDYEVLLMIDPLDEYIMQSITEYGDKKFINVMKDDLKLEDKKDNNEEDDNICKKIKEILNNKIESVKISNKLDSQPAIVTSPMGWSANMERIMKAQALHNGYSSFMMDRKVLEINLEHKLIKKLIENEYNEEYINIIYNIGLLAGGYDLTDVNDFLIKLYNYL